VVDQSRAHSGKYAVHIKVAPGSQNVAQLVEKVTFPAKNNSFYARMFAYFTPDLPAQPGGDFHMGFLFGAGKNSHGDVTAGMGLNGGAKQYLSYSIFFGSPSFEFGPWSKTTVVPNAWLCIELFEDGSNPDTELRRVWLNDTELTDLMTDSAKAGGGAHPNHQPPQFDQLKFGIWEYHPTPTLSEIWMDDVRVSTMHIGCMN